MTTSTKFGDKIAEKYSKQPIADEAAYQKNLAVTRDYFRPGMEVLKISCGKGSSWTTSGNPAKTKPCS